MSYILTFLEVYMGSEYSQSQKWVALEKASIGFFLLYL